MSDSIGFNIQDFRSKITEYHRSSNFHMLLNQPPGLQANLEGATDTLGKLHYLIESSTIPGIELATDEIRRYGFGAFQRKPYVPVFEPITAIVRSDADGSAYDFFQAWIKMIINYDTQKGIDSAGRNGHKPYEISYKSDYAVDADIVSYDDSGNESIRVTMKEFFPIYLGDISMGWDNGNSIVKFPMKFTYTDWFQPDANQK